MGMGFMCLCVSAGANGFVEAIFLYLSDITRICFGGGWMVLWQYIIIIILINTPSWPVCHSPFTMGCRCSR